MSEDYKIQSAYEGGECQVKYAVPASKKFEMPKANHNITFHNAEGHEVGTLDFNGPGLAFEGVAEMSAIVFMDWVSKKFQARLQEEYDKGFKDGKASQTTG
jgi:predicted alpha/beta hydrolase